MLSSYFQNDLKQFWQFGIDETDRAHSRLSSTMAYLEWGEAPLRGRRPAVVLGEGPRQGCVLSPVPDGILVGCCLAKQPAGISAPEYPAQAMHRLKHAQCHMHPCMRKVSKGGPLRGRGW